MQDTTAEKIKHISHCFKTSEQADFGGRAEPEADCHRLLLDPIPFPQLDLQREAVALLDFRVCQLLSKILQDLSDVGPRVEAFKLCPNKDARDFFPRQERLNRNVGYLGSTQRLEDSPEVRLRRLKYCISGKTSQLRQVQYSGQ